MLPRPHPASRIPHPALPGCRAHCIAAEAEARAVGHAMLQGAVGHAMLQAMTEQGHPLPASGLEYR